MCACPMTDKVLLSTMMCPAGRLCANVNCRNTKYPRSQVERFHVPDDKVDWTVDWPSYRPPTFTSPGAIGKPWSDPEHRYWPEVSRYVIEPMTDKQ